MFKKLLNTLIRDKTEDLSMRHTQIAYENWIRSLGYTRVCVQNRGDKEFWTRLEDGKQYASKHDFLSLWTLETVVAKEIKVLVESAVRDAQNV